MRTKLISIVLLGLVFGLQAVTVQAHSFITNQERSGAVVHITPDDNPIAGGDTSSIHFDIQSDSVSDESHFLALAVQEPNGEVTRLSVNVIDNLVVSDFAFTQKGEHVVRVTATDKQDGSVEEFVYIQEVVRSVDDQGFTINDDTLPRLLAVWSFAGLALVIWLAVRHKKALKS